MIEISFYDKDEPVLCSYAVILAKTAKGRLFCKHREHDGCEPPGGHVETGERPLETAARELCEETGALDFRLEPLFIYSANERNKAGILVGTQTYGLVCGAYIERLGAELHHEIGALFTTDTLPEKWAYPDIHPQIVAEAIRRGVY